MRMRDWELLASPNQLNEGSMAWFIDFYKDRGLDEQKLNDIFSIPLRYEAFSESIKKYIQLYPDDDSLQFASDFWDNSQAAIDEYYRVRSTFLFQLHSIIFNCVNWVVSWGKCFHLRVYDSTRKEKALLYRTYYFDVYKERNEEKRRRPLLGLRLEIVVPSKLGLGIEFTVGGEDQLQLGIFAWKLGSCWLTITDLFPRKWLPANERETGITLYEDHLSFQLWWDDCGWDSRFRGINQGVFLLDWFFGRAKYERSSGVQQRLEIYLPEATYEGTAEIYTATWTRPRAWWKAQVSRVEINFPQGIPIPGKGENDYDMDEDAIYSSCMVAFTMEEAAQRFVEDILNTRQKYGGIGWKPKENAWLN